MYYKHSSCAGRRTVSNFEPIYAQYCFFGAQLATADDMLGNVVSLSGGNGVFLLYGTEHHAQQDRFACNKEMPTVRVHKRIAG